MLAAGADGSLGRERAKSAAKIYRVVAASQSSQGKPNANIQ